MPSTFPRRALFYAFAANFLHNACINLFVHFPGFLQERGASEVRIGLFVSTLFAAGILARPAIARLLDSRGRRLVSLVGGVLHVVAALLYLTVDDLGAWLLVVRVVHGVAQAMVFSVLMTLAGDLVPESRRGYGLALFGTSGMLSLVVVGVLGDWILAHRDYSVLFLTASGFALGGLLATLPLPDTRPEHHSAAPVRSFLTSILDRRIRSLWVAGLSYALGLSTCLIFLKTYTAETGHGAVGPFFTAFGCSAIVLRIGFGWVPDRVGARRVLFPALGFAAAGLATLALGCSGSYLVVAGILMGIGHGYAFPVIATLVVERALPSERGAGMAMFTALFDVGSLAGGPLFGLLVEGIGHQGMYAVASAMILAGTILFGVLDRGR